MAGVTIAGVTIDDRGLDRLRASLREMDAKTVFVGVLSSGKGNEPHGAVTNVDVATWMEFGTVTESGDEHVPERSFLRETIALKKSEIEARLAVEMKAILTGKRSVDAALERVGQFVVGLCQQRIKAGIAPANDPATIARKGSSTPLIDSGQLRSSITYEVRG